MSDLLKRLRDVSPDRRAFDRFLREHPGARVVIVGVAE